MPFLYVSTKEVAHITTQIRLKQLAIQSAQDKIQDAILEEYEENYEITEEEFENSVKKKLSYFTALSTDLINNISKEVTDVGFPIKYSKTRPQLEMAYSFVSTQDESFIANILNGKFYKNLFNNIDGLPVLQADSSDFWGNENSSVSSVLLATIADTLKIDIKNLLPRAATFYPFFKEDYKITPPDNYPFANKNGMYLFGDYQFGGHRYFSNNPYPDLGQLIFGPEDCSSAVGKAINLTEDQIIGIYTGALKSAYSNPENEYSLMPIATSENGATINPDLIQPGDIYVNGGHTTIISSAIDNKGNFDTLGFNRDIDCAEGKQLGGGSYIYNLQSQIAKNPVYILRKNTVPLKESCSLSDFLNSVDYQYAETFPNGPTQDQPGDCGNLLGLYDGVD